MAFDVFLKLDGIQGESTVKGHEGEIELDSFSFGLTNPAAGGRPVFQDFRFTSKVGKHTPQLFLACAQGAKIRTGLFTLDSVSGGGTLVPDLKIVFETVLITEHKIMDIASLKLEDAVSPQGGLITSGPEDSASFSFGRVTISSGGKFASLFAG
jgi:type VI secretion system secreted protein Hcp